MYIKWNIFSHLRGRNSFICDNMKEPRGHYTLGNKACHRKTILYNVTYMWSLRKWNS